MFGKTQDACRSLVLAVALAGPAPAFASTLALLQTAREGVHRLDFATAANVLGRTPEAVKQDFAQGGLALYWQGTPVAVRPLTNGTGLLFYAPFTSSRYFEGAVFELRPGTSPTVPEVPLGLFPENQIAEAYARETFETNRVAVLTVPGSAESELWFGDNFLGGHPTFGTRTYTFPLNGVVAGATADSLLVALVSNSDITHDFAATLNGVELGTTNWMGRRRLEWTLPIPPATLRAQTNQLVLSSRGERASLVYLDRFEVTHGHDLHLRDLSVVFTVPASGLLTASADTTGPVQVWEVSRPASPALVGGSVSENPPSRTFVAEAGGRYEAFTAAMAALPVRWQGITPVIWREVSLPELVLVAPETLLPATESLAQYRRGQGLPTLVISWEQVCQEFAFGEPRPAAIREFLRAAATHWGAPPHYLTLLGDGTYDYKNQRGGNDNLLPPELTFTAFGWTAVDPGLGDLDGDGLPEVAVGRLPLHAAGEMTGLLARLAAYEQLSPAAPPSALMFAGRGDDAGDFPADSLAVATELGDGFTKELFHDVDLSLEDARAGLRQRLAAGTAFWNYIGHGGRDRLGNGYVALADVPSLDFGGLPPLFAAMTCSVGQFNVPTAPCLGEELLLRAPGGPLMVWSPSGFSFNVQAHLLNLHLVRQLAQSSRGRRVGDLLQATVASFRAAGGDSLTPQFYNLLGDPATRLPFGVPEPKLVLTLKLQGEGRAELSLQGPAKVECRLEHASSVAPASWNTLQTVTTDESGKASVLLETSAAAASHFFRVLFPATP